MDLKISVSPELEQDDFLLGFFLAERELMRGRQLLELTTLSFREWESFFRDLNHQLCVSEGEFLRCEKLHEELMNALVEEIFNHAWERATTDLGPLPQEKWIEALAWVSEVLEKFFDHLSSADRGFELLSWRSEGNFPQEMILTIGHAPGLKLSQAVLERMKIFLQRALPETKEIKLVAE